MNVPEMGMAWRGSRATPTRSDHLSVQVSHMQRVTALMPEPRFGASIFLIAIRTLLVSFAMEFTPLDRNCSTPDFNEVRKSPNRA